MRKTDKKRENAIINTLTQVCDTAQERYEGFEWLTHLVNYDSFPGSLKVVCIFDTNDNLESFDEDEFRTLIKTKLASIGIAIDARKQIRFDTEETCAKENNGRWPERLQ